jgi:hypothetical protein
MVTRIVCLVGCLTVLLAVTQVPANAAYCGPMGCQPQVPVCGPPAPVCPPAPCGPSAMSCMPNCPPPCACPPSMCQQRSGCGFNPLRAVFSVITFPFRLIARAVNRQDCQPQPPMYCPPPGCMPVYSPPAVKCRPGRAVYHGRRAAYRYQGPAPMLNPMTR